MLSAINNKVMPVIMSVSFQMWVNPNPFTMIDFTITINHRGGIIVLKACKRTGIFSMGKMNPESNIVGNMRANMESIIAICCELLTVEINIPNDKAIRINSKLSAKSKNNCPFTGISSTKKLSNSMVMALIKASNI